MNVYCIMENIEKNENNDLRKALSTWEKYLFNMLTFY